MTDYWLENAAQPGRHTLVDCGYFSDAASKARYDRLLPPLPRPRGNESLPGCGKRDYKASQMTAYGQSCQAAATAEARALVGQFLEAHNYVKHTPSHLFEQKRARELMNAAADAGVAWLGEAQKGDGHHG